MVSQSLRARESTYKHHKYALIRCKGKSHLKMFRFKVPLGCADDKAIMSAADLHVFQSQRPVLKPCAVRLLMDIYPEKDLRPSQWQVSNNCRTLNRLRTQDSRLSARLYNKRLLPRPIT